LQFFTRQESKIDTSMVHLPPATPREIDMGNVVNDDNLELSQQQHLHDQSEKRSLYGFGSKCVTACFLLCSFVAIASSNSSFLTDRAASMSSKKLHGDDLTTRQHRVLHHPDNEKQHSRRDLQALANGLEVLLVNDETIRAGDKFEFGSYRDRVYITQQTDGNLVVYQNGRPLWASGVRLPRQSYFTVLQKDGNLVTRAPNRKVVWATDSHTADGLKGSCFFAINTNDAELEIIRGNELEPAETLWKSGTLDELLGEELNKDLTFDELMKTDTVLGVGESVEFDGGFLTQEASGRLVLRQYQREGSPREVWSSSVDDILEDYNYYSILQGDGNLVTYDGDGKDVWDSNSVMEGGYYGNFFLVVVKDDDSNGEDKLAIIHGSLSNPDDTVWEETIELTPFMPESPAPSPKPSPAPMEEGDVKLILEKDESIESDDPIYFNGGSFVQQPNGNIVLYKGGEEKWSSGVDDTEGYHRTMLQGDGNMVTLNAQEQVVWASNSHTPIHGDYYLVVDSAKVALEIYRGASTNPGPKVWSSLDGPIAPPPPPPPGPLPPFFDSGIESGPLVGHTTDVSTRIWAFQGQGKTMRLTYKRDGSNTSKTINMPPRSNNNRSALAYINGLVASTRYTYDITVDGKKVAQGQFKTAPSRAPTEFQYLLTSCINVLSHKGYPVQPVWDSTLWKQPDFAMLAGDTIYLTEQDWTSGSRTVIYDRVWYRNMQQRKEKHFARVISNVPTYSAWDDHEYGSNNAERNQSGKENSLKAFKDVWANPGAGTPQITGTFYSYYWGDVHFIVMDNRWYRWKNDRTQFGENQKQWLYDQLKNSNAPFKIIVAGCDIMEAGFGDDLDDIGRVVKANRISGVLFNAGDIHRNEYKEQRNGNWPYPVKQITSSGIARDNWMRPYAMVHVNTKLDDPEITAYFYGADTRDLQTTWSNDPTLICSSIEGTDRIKESRCTETIRLSQLQA